MVLATMGGKKSMLRQRIWSPHPSSAEPPLRPESSPIYNRVNLPVSCRLAAPKYHAPTSGQCLETQHAQQQANDRRRHSTTLCITDPKRHNTCEPDHPRDETPKSPPRQRHRHLCIRIAAPLTSSTPLAARRPQPMRELPAATHTHNGIQLPLTHK